MMVERHYDEETLIALLESPDPAATARDRHLASCKSCSETLDSFRTMSQVLGESAVWDTREFESEPSASTIATLRAFADGMTREDVLAESMLAELTAGPRESWMPRLAANPQYRTPGMVRRLIAATDRAIDTMPPDALELTAMATAIADHLDPATCGGEVVARLRGGAWRERAYVLLYVGNFKEALAACDIADDQFSRLAVDRYERARLSIVRSHVARGVENYEGALSEARSGALTFREFGDFSRFISSRSSEAAVLGERGRLAEALELWLQLAATYSPDDFSDAHARLLSNIAYAYRRLGSVDQALKYFNLAADLYETAGTPTESARVRWNIGSLLLDSGRVDAAARELETTYAELRRLGMASSVALVGLLLAEIRLLQGRTHEVADLCRASMEQFVSAGVEYCTPALTAIAYIDEAIEAGKATPQLVRHVREYVHRLPASPALLFAPLPPELD